MAMYFSHAQSPGRAMNVVVRASGTPEQLAGAVRAVIHDVDPDLPIYGVRTMDDRISASLATRRFAVQLLSLFALVGMALAVIGVYSVLSYVVNQSGREMGIRLALGATPRQVQRFVLRQGAIVTVAGIGLGLAGALLTTRFMQSLLFGVTTTDPLTFGAVLGALLLAGVGASYAPARRASRTDPAVSLRAE
jgi:putative ABC transport system permease protein